MLIAPPQTPHLTHEQQELEMMRCAASPLYFVMNYVNIFDPTVGGWIPFVLWEAQRYVLRLIHQNKYVIILKPRQVGVSWIVDSYIMWGVLFRPTYVALLFAHTEDEAKFQIGRERMRGIYQRLPIWMQAQSVKIDDVKHWELSNGSSVRAFSPNRGDSYSANLAFLDEADLYPDLKTTLGRVQPTIEAGGKLVIVSRSNKKKPMSLFKQMYRAARDGKNDYVSAFLPWWVHPDRDDAWYERIKANAMENEGSTDSVDEQYPAMDEEALRANTLDKRLHPEHLRRAFKQESPMPPHGIAAQLMLETSVHGHWNPEPYPAINGLEVFRLPVQGVSYSVGIDSAEGKDNSDDSSICVVRTDTLEQVCKLSGKIEYTTLASYADEIGRWYNYAMVMPERNNHGHAVIQWLLEHSGLGVGLGHDNNEGWLSSARGKALLYSAAATVLQDENPIIHSRKTYTQLQSIERSTLRAPENMADDDADGWALAIAGAVNYSQPFTGVL